MYSAKALQAYQQSHRDGLEVAHPTKWVGALLDEAVLCCNLSINAIAAKNIALRGMKSSKAISILNEGLIPALDENQGEISTNLLSLYAYCARLLFDANRLADVSKYEECRKLLSEIREGWRAVENMAAVGS